MNTSIRHVQWTAFCDIIPDEQPSSNASSIFNHYKKSFAYHLGWSSSTHGRKNSSASDDDPLNSPPSKLGRSLSLSSRSRAPTSPIEANYPPPLKGILKRRSSTSSHAIPSPTFPHPSNARQHQHHVPVPADTEPLRTCCKDCVPVVDKVLALGSKYKITWSPGALAKKRRDDAEEARDILAGLKEGCLIKWAAASANSDERDEKDDDSPCDPLAKLDIEALKSASSDSLSKLDGTKGKDSFRSQEWTPTKYYDEDEDEDNLFPLPKGSPLGSPVDGSRSPVSPVMDEKLSDLLAAHNKPNGVHQPTIGLSPIMSSPVSMSRSGSSVSSASTHPSDSSAGHRARIPSPLSQHMPHDSLSPYDEFGRRGHGSNKSMTKDPKKQTTHVIRSSTPSIAGSNSTGSSRTNSSIQWQFVPPPLPAKGSARATSNKPVLTAAPNTISPLTQAARGSAGASKDSLQVPAVTSRTQASNATQAPPAQAQSTRANPPYMPTYSGAQREVVVIASSKHGQEGQPPARPPPNRANVPLIRQLSGDKDLPPTPGTNSSASSQSTPTATPMVSGGSGYMDRGDDIGRGRAGKSRSNTTSSTGGDSSSSGTTPRGTPPYRANALSLLTSPPPARSAGSNVRMDSGETSPGVRRSPSAGSSSTSRSRSSSFRKLLNGMSMASGIPR